MNEEKISYDQIKTIGEAVDFGEVITKKNYGEVNGVIVKVNVKTKEEADRLINRLTR